jgi:peptidoglycan/LPS O-acetylase OafA/YrhL
LRFAHLQDGTYPILTVQRSQQALVTNFRNDINGLRAWAVVVVILYHFNVPGFVGGFAGVDVFFVISGYLMTQIICKGLARRDFSLFSFYVARAIRIFPALIALCAVLMLVGWFTLLPPDYKTLGAHSSYSLAFLSNIEYWLSAGYFDEASHEKWLLHTWSLSVEWQFYLLLPVILLGLAKIAPSAANQRRVLLGLFGLSLAVCVSITIIRPSEAFFLIHTRAWEMLAGGLVYLFAPLVMISVARRRLMEPIGLVLILVSVTVFDRTSIWPGWYAALPVFATMLVLLAACGSAGTGNRAAQWLGDRSYSLYLWHWPVYVALAYADKADNTSAICAGLVVTLILAALSYSWIEKPSRSFFKQGTAIRNATILTGMLAVVLGGATVIWTQQGFNGRFAPQVELVAAEARNFNPYRTKCHQIVGSSSPACLFGGTQRKVLLVGDSHGAAVVSALVSAKPGGDAGVVQLTYDGCVFVPTMRQLQPKRFGPNNNCTEYNQWVAAQLAAAPPEVPVVLVGRYARSAFGQLESRLGAEVPEVYFLEKRYSSTTPEFLQEFSEAVRNSACELAKKRTVYMMRPIPEMPVNVPKYMARKMAFGLNPDVSVSTEQYMHRNGWLWRAQNEARDRCGIRILDPTTSLCRNNLCKASKDGRPLYYDHGHLSEFGNRLLIPMFSEVYKYRP